MQENYIYLKLMNENEQKQHVWNEKMMRGGYLRK